MGAVLMIYFLTNSFEQTILHSNIDYNLCKISILFHCSSKSTEKDHLRTIEEWRIFFVINRHIDYIEKELKTVIQLQINISTNKQKNLKLVA